MNHQSSISFLKYHYEKHILYRLYGEILQDSNQKIICRLFVIFETFLYFLRVNVSRAILFASTASFVPILILRFMDPTWGPTGSCRPQVGPMLAHELCYLGMLRRHMLYAGCVIHSIFVVIFHMSTFCDYVVADHCILLVLKQKIITNTIHS